MMEREEAKSVLSGAVAAVGVIAYVAAWFVIAAYFVGWDSPVLGLFACGGLIGFPRVVEILYAAVSIAMGRK